MNGETRLHIGINRVTNIKRYKPIKNNFFNPLTELENNRMSNKKLYMMVKFNSSMIGNLLSSHRHMHNFLVNIQKIQDIRKQFATNRINEHGNVPRCEVVPTFSDLEVIVLSLTAEAFRTSSSKD